MKTVIKHRFVYAGTDHSDYNQGIGTSFTEWSEAFQGMGHTPEDAFEDALNDAATNGWNIEHIEHPFKGDNAKETVCAKTCCEFVGVEDPEDCRDCGMYCWAHLYLKGV